MLHHYNQLYTLSTAAETNIHAWTTLGSVQMCACKGDVWVVDHMEGKMSPLHLHMQDDLEHDIITIDTCMYGESTVLMIAYAVENDKEETKFFLSSYRCSSKIFKDNGIYQAFQNIVPETITLDFIPFQLTHRVHDEHIDFLLSGGDKNLYIYNVSSSSLKVMSILEGILSSAAISLYVINKDLVVLGCQDGLLILVNMVQEKVLANEFSQGPISFITARSHTSLISNDIHQDNKESVIDLIVGSVLGFAYLFQDILHTKLAVEETILSPETFGAHDSILCAHFMDVDLDGEEELLIGTHCGNILMLSIEKVNDDTTNKEIIKVNFKESKTINSTPIFAIDHTNLSGVPCLIAMSLNNVHVMEMSYGIAKHILTKKLEMLKL